MLARPLALVLCAAITMLPCKFASLNLHCLPPPLHWLQRHAAPPVV